MGVANYPKFDPDLSLECHLALFIRGHRYPHSHNVAMSVTSKVEVFTDRISIWISIGSCINAGYGSYFIIFMDMDMNIRSWIYIIYENDSSNILKSYTLYF